MGAAQIKGSTLKLRTQFVRERWGEAALEKVLATLSPQDADSVMKSLPVLWYPLSLNAHLDQTICHVLGNGNERIYEEMGAYSADAFARQIYSTYFEETKPQQFLDLTVELYKNYYKNAGQRRNVVSAPGRCDMYIEGCREAYRPNCASNVGFIRRSLVLLGARGVRCDEVSCALADRERKGVCIARATWLP